METRGKVREYLGAGGVEVWLLDYANREVQVQTRTEIRVLQANHISATPLLPGFAVTVADLGLKLYNPTDHPSHFWLDLIRIGRKTQQGT